jgi:Fusaric acid resistance protein family
MTNGTADPAARSATASPRRSSYRSSDEVRRFWPAAGQIDWFDARLLASAIRSAGPPLLFGLRLWASVSLALHVAFWLELDDAFWAGTSAALVCQPHLGASLRKGWFLMIGTVVGAVAIVVLVACFPQARAPFLVGLALWGAACALVATLLRNFAAYAAALAGYTAAIVASDTLGATGGTDGQVFLLAICRASEICIGIVCAGIVLAGTDLGGARRRLAALFAALSSEIAGRFAGTLALAGPGLPETQPVRRELLRRVIALDPVIDEAIGESS